MWKLTKPSLARAKRDIDVLIQHCRNLGNGDKPLLETLYDEYENGNGEVTPAQLQPLNNKADDIRMQYVKTFDTKANNQLYYIRRDLMKKVQKCPYCSINPPAQLDHYMDKSTYGQLATCRLNLVPLCGSCNHLKSNTTYKDFVHPYYQSFPTVPFLIADCKVVKDRVVVSFKIDKSVIQGTLLHKTQKQMKHIKLQRRLQMAAQEFITEKCFSCMASTDAELQVYLSSLLKLMESMWNLNDWRTSIVRGLIACKQFDINVVNNIKASVKPVNGGGA